MAQTDRRTDRQIDTQGINGQGNWIGPVGPIQWKNFPSLWFQGTWLRLGNNSDLFQPKDSVFFFFRKCDAWSQQPNDEKLNAGPVPGILQAAAYNKEGFKFKVKLSFGFSLKRTRYYLKLVINIINVIIMQTAKLA